MIYRLFISIILKGYLLSFVVFNSIIPTIYAQNSGENNLLNNFLIEDLKELKANTNSEHLKNISAVTYIKLFHEGIHGSISLLDSIRHPTKKRSYKKLLKKTLSRLNKQKNKHLIIPSNASLNFKKANSKWGGLGMHIFNNFSGKWFGYWERNSVSHYWLSSKELTKNETVTITSEIDLKIYQSAFTGDGFGWNYQVSKNGDNYIIGFVCHFNNEGTIDMKRFHVGIPQSNNSIIWITKDHIYFEFVCNDLKHRKLPLHYVISGSYYKKKQKRIKIIRLFQGIYTNKPIGNFGV